MNIGKLNRRITIEYVTTATDPEGYPIETWTTFAKPWAAREPLRGDEFWNAAATNAEKTVKYRIRYRKGIKANMRLTDHVDGLTYNIVVPLDDFYGDRTQTHLMVELIEDG